MTFIEILFLNVWKNFTILKCIINNFISNYGFQGDCWFVSLCIIKNIVMKHSNTIFKKEYFSRTIF